MARYVIGVDAGGTKTRLVIGDLFGNIIFDKTTRGISHNKKSTKYIEKIIKTIYIQGLTKTKLKEEQIELIFLGLSGADTKSDYDRLTTNCLSVFQHGRFIIDNDAWVSFRSGTKNNYGAVCISGTGANAGAVNHLNERAICLAIGYSFGAHGGGLDMAREALHQIYRDYEMSGIKTSLKEKILKRFNLQNMEELTKFMYPVNHMNVELLGAITYDVFEAANEGDKVARDILIKMGSSLGQMVLGNIKKVNMVNEEFPLVLGGSLFKGEGSLFIDSLKEVVLKEAKNAKIILPEYPPVIGAYLYALDNLGIIQTKEIDSNILKSIG